MPATMRRILIPAFILPAAAYTAWATLSGDHAPPVAVLLKTGATLVLAVLAWLSLRDRADRPRSAFAVGLLFCAAGDTFLGLERATLTFQLGLGSFLVGYGIVAWGLAALAAARRMLAFLPATLALGIAQVLYLDVPGDFLLPIIAFTLVQTSLLTVGLAAGATAGLPARGLLAAGAALLYLSDSLIGLSLFKPALGMAGGGAALGILATYYAGLGLLATGLLRRD